MTRTGIYFHGRAQKAALPQHATPSPGLAEAESQQASYVQSVAHVQTVKAITQSTKASTEQARANAEQLGDNLTRNKALVASGVISGSIRSSS